MPGSSPASSLIKLETTGQVALDAILGGGIPAHSVTVIAGEPGSGKTVLTLQMLFHAARAGRKCLYFTTLSEPALKVIRYMQAFDFFNVELLDSLIQFVDLGAAVRKGAEAVTREIISRVERHEPEFVAIDSFRSIGELMPTAAAARPFVYDLASQTASWGTTTLLVGEYTRKDMASFTEFAVADGILWLGAERQELTSIRNLEVMKLRGADYVSGRHFFEIGSGGLRVYPRVRAPVTTDEQVDLSAREGTGVAGLDTLLDGGLPANSATVVQGASGTGKTLLALNFLLEGVRLGQRVVLFTMEETPAQLRAIGLTLGWDLAAHEASGQFVLSHTSPVELATDRFLNSAREQVARLGAQRVVFDSLTTMALGVPSPRRFKELVYSLAKHMRAVGTSLLMTIESDHLLATPGLPGLGVSFMADNLIQLRYFEHDGRLGRAISVLKARGVALNTELRVASIGPGGVSVTDQRFPDRRGVVSGLPSSGSSV